MNDGLHNLPPGVMPRDLDRDAVERCECCSQEWPVVKLEDGWCPRCRHAEDAKDNDCARSE